MKICASASIYRNYQRNKILSTESSSVNNCTDRYIQQRAGTRLFNIAQINGIDVREARHEQALSLLMGSEHELRLTLLRSLLVPKVRH